MHDTTHFERLEDRRLLAVSVGFKAKGGILTIKGDGASDEVDIVGTGVFGEVDVYVNGGFEGTFGGVKTIKAKMGGGDDDFGLDAVQIGGALVVDLGQGADTFDIDTYNEFDDVFGSVFIGGSVIANLGNNAGDFVDWSHEFGGEGAVPTFVIGNNVTLAGAADVDLDGNGGTSAAEPEDITIGGFLRISTKVSGDVDGDGHTLDVDDVNVGGTTIVALTAGDDDVDLTDSSFARRVAISLGGGDDFIDNGDSDGNTFGAAVVVNGGAGFDEIEEDSANVYAVAPVLRGIELVTPT